MHQEISSPLSCSDSQSPVWTLDSNFFPFSSFSFSLLVWSLCRPQADSSLMDPQSPGWLNGSSGPQQQQQHSQQQPQPTGSGIRLSQTQPPQLQQQPSYSPSSSPVAPRLLRARCYQQQDSQESLSSMPDPGDPTTVTRTYRPGRKASAQASLASRDKTPNAKSRRRRGKGKHAGVFSLSVTAICIPIHYQVV